MVEGQAASLFIITAFSGELQGRAVLSINLKNRFGALLLHWFEQNRRDLP
jgi:hypothetical protein